MSLEYFKRTIRNTKKKINVLKIANENMIKFIEHYRNLICDSDGIFGVLSDEILLNIMSYLRPNELLLPPCSRFRKLTIDALKISTGELCSNMSKYVRNNMVKYIFKYDVCYYCYFYHYKYKTKKLTHMFTEHKKGDLCRTVFSSKTKRILRIDPIGTHTYIIEYKGNDTIKTYFTNKNMTILHINKNIVRTYVVIRNNGAIDIYSDYKINIKCNGFVEVHNYNMNNKCLFKRIVKGKK